MIMIEIGYQAPVSYLYTVLSLYIMILLHLSIQCVEEAMQTLHLRPMTPVIVTLYPNPTGRNVILAKKGSKFPLTALLNKKNIF